MAQYITNRHPFHNDEVERLDAIDRANRKTLRAVGLRETHAPHPATRLPYATSFVLPPDEDALLEARPPTGPSVLCDMPLPVVPGCFRFQKGVLPLVLIFAQGPRSVSDLQVHLEALRHSRGVPVFCAYVDTLANTPFADVGLRDNISFWLDLILSGRVCAVIALSGRSIWHSSDHPQAFRCKQRFWGALTLPEIQHEHVERDNDFLQIIFLVHKTCQQYSVACMSIAPLPDTPEECNFMDEPRICELFQDSTHCHFTCNPTTM